MWAIVPIKTFDRAKQRLANVLSEEERRTLMLAMARDVLTCLSKCTHLDGILIVSRTTEADALAQSFATERFAESPDADLPQALQQGTEYLLANFDVSGVIIVPADVPCITPAELDLILSQHTRVTLMPDTDHVGTNGMICSPPLCMPYVFDGRSFKPHADAAFAAGITPTVLPGTCFALDVDVPADLLAVIEQAPGTQTTHYLIKSGIAERLAAYSNSQSG